MKAGDRPGWKTWSWLAVGLVDSGEDMDLLLPHNDGDGDPPGTWDDGFSGVFCGISELIDWDEQISSTSWLFAC